MIVELILWVFGGYLFCGFLFAILFLIKGINKVDQNAPGSTIGFRIIIIPGLILLWPVLVKKWMNTPKKRWCMTRTLRKTHLLIWRILCLALPLGIISAWLVIPPAARNKLLQPNAGPYLPVIIDSVSTDHYLVKLRAAADHSSFQLEWVNRVALTIPSAIIYQASPPGFLISDAEIIGRIDPRGAYIFPLKNDPGHNGHHFIVYDIIHHQVTERINFKQ